MSMVWIAGQTVGAGGASTITFSSIPQNFTHLQLRIFGRGTTSFSSGLSAYVFLNNDSTGANYVVHGLFGNGSGAFSTAILSSGTLGTQQVFADSSATSGVFGSVIYDFLDYTNTNKNKVSRSIGGWDGNGSGRVMLYSGAYLSTAAINQIQIATDGNLVAGTRADLYGITTSSVTGA